MLAADVQGGIAMMPRTLAALTALRVAEEGMDRPDSGAAEVEAVMQARDVVALSFAEETRGRNPDFDGTYRAIRHDVTTKEGRAWIERAAIDGGAS